jgi:hypothetical protein
MDRYEPDRRLDEAARESPGLADLLAGRHEDPSPRYRRIAAIVGAAALAIGAAWLALSALPRPRRAEPAEEIDRSVYLPPIETRPTPAGEETSPFTGFAVAIDTDPPGALVSVGAAVRGEAPVLANVPCRGSEKVRIRAEKRGYRPASRDVACRTDTLVKLTLRLER